VLSAGFVLVRVTVGVNIDITPTFINIAGLFPRPEHDGKSLLPLLTAGAEPQLAKAVERKLQWRSSQIIEYLR
jgi:hypothetical protein